MKGQAADPWPELISGSKSDGSDELPNPDGDVVGVSGEVEVGRSEG